jgi:hypothetical protein
MSTFGEGEMTNTRNDGERQPYARTSPREEPTYEPQPRRSGYHRQSIAEAMAKSFIRSIASNLGRIIARTLTRGMR